MSEDLRLPLSVCLIVKNEAEFLNTCLASVRGMGSELIVTDFKSTDTSLKIIEAEAKHYPHSILKSLDWQDDFAWARNETAKYASQPWVFFIDGDEGLDSDSKTVLRNLITENRIHCGSVIQRNYTYDSSLEGATPLKLWPEALEKSDRPLFFFDNWMERLFRSDLGLKYSSRIHESLLPSCESLGLVHERLNIVLHHYGRVKKSPTRKTDYYLKLSLRKLEEESENPVSWVEACVALLEADDLEKAFETASLAQKKFGKIFEVNRVAIQCALRTSRFAVAERWILDSLIRKPSDIWLLSQQSTALLYQRKLDEALELATNLLSLDAENFVALINAAVVLFERNDLDNAARYLQTAQKLRPSDAFVEQALKKISAARQKH